MKKASKKCGFYVNSLHLSMMILPYVKNKIEREEKVIIISDENLESNIKTILNKLNLKEEVRNQIIKIGENIIKEEKITKKINEYDEIIIIGKEKYIDRLNKKVKGILEKEDISIVDFYEVMDFNNNIEKILSSHERLVNTAGEKSIKEAFEGFEKKEII